MGHLATRPASSHPGDSPAVIFSVRRSTVLLPFSGLGQRGSIKHLALLALSIGLLAQLDDDLFARVMRKCPPSSMLQLILESTKVLNKYYVN